MKFPCPKCGQPTRAVKPITLRSLLSEKSRARVASYDGFRFCPTTNCALLYVQPQANLVFGSDAVIVPVFQKSTEATRPVCYCFHHSAREIHREAALAGVSQIVQSIAEKCRQGEDRCEETNPQGSCCLGNVRAVLHRARSERGLEQASQEPASETSCCHSPRKEDKPE